MGAVLVHFGFILASGGPLKRVVGCWVGILKGIPRYTIMFEDLKDSKHSSSKNTKIPRPSKVLQKISKIVQTYFRLIGINIGFKDLRISKIYQDSTIVFSRFYLNDRDWKLFLALQKTTAYFSSLCFLSGPSISNLLISKMLRSIATLLNRSHTFLYF